MDRRSFVWLLAASAAGSGQDSRPSRDDSDVLRAFLKRPKDAQQKAMLELRRQIAAIDSPWLRRIEELAAIGSRLKAAKPQGLVVRQPHKEEGSPFEELPCVIRCEYVWGHHAVRPYARRVPKSSGTGKSLVQLPLDSPAEDLFTALQGLHPDTDLALAGAQAELDQSTAADRLAQFLESWRNGQESFYRALDRTAGTKDSVFYFDVMLGEFQVRFAPKGSPAADELKSLKAQHDALHDAFLVYRQYRGMREAAACSAVLALSCRLPSCLQRYDKQKDGYTLRDDLAILAALDGHDPLPGLRMIHATMAPLPTPLWATHGKYEALLPFQQAFDARFKKALSERAEGDLLSSESLHTRTHLHRNDVHTRIRELAHRLGE